MKESFFPIDKPKSFVVFLCAVLFCLLVIGPILGLAIALKIDWLLNVGRFGFFACWAVAFPFGIVLTVGICAGKYRNIEHKKWKDQVW